MFYYILIIFVTDTNINTIMDHNHNIDQRLPLKEVNEFANYCLKKNINTIDDAINKLSCGCDSQQLSQDLGISINHSKKMCNVYNMIGGDDMKNIAKTYCATNHIANIYKGGDSHNPSQPMNSNKFNMPNIPNRNRPNAEQIQKVISQGKSVIKNIDKGVDHLNYASGRAGTVAQSIQQIANAGKDVKSIFSRPISNSNKVNISDIDNEISRIDKEILELQNKKKKLLNQKILQNRK